MTNKLSCLSTTTLTQLAHGEVLPDELHDIEEHVTDCEPCRHAIQMAEDDPHWTNDILPVLKAPTEEVPPSDDPKICADNESVRRLLGPTDDPNMLGRIGSYEIAGIVGRGGMGIVFKAFDASLDRFVAIKMLLPHLAESGAARKRFSREARAAAAVIDDHVLPIFGVDEWQGTPYLVTQYSRGMTLQKRIHEQGPLELKEILRIGLQTARGLAAAHAQGLVHRDVKPSNILLDGTVERALLTDFGLARAADDASVTRTGTVTGTPQYMSPEQVRGELVDARSDLFSLGSTLYAMCTGRSPFRADSTYAVMHRITEGALSPIQQVNPEIPEWLCDVITKLMANRPNDRFESAQEIAELLEECLAHVQQPMAVPLPKRCLELRTDFVTSNGQKPTTAERSPVRRGLLLLTLGFAMCLAGVLIVLETGKGKLTIESEADGVPIRITQDGEVVKRLTVSKTGAGVRAAAGQYRIEIEGDIDGLAVDKGNTVTLERRGEEIVRIVYATKSPESVPENAASGGDDSSTQDRAEFEDQATSNGFSGVYVVHVSPSKGETKLDLDRGEKFGPIVGPSTADLSFPMSADAPSSTVFALNSIVSALPDEDPWSLPLEDVRDRLATEKRVPALRLAGPRDELPKCFAFQTNAGAVGILSVDGIDPDTGNTTIRYRIRITNKAIVDFTQTPGHAAVNDDMPGAVSFHGMSLEGAPRTNTFADLPDLFHADPPGSFKIRPEVHQVYAEADGTVYYLPDNNVFYIQHNPVGSRQKMYYGPFDGNPVEELKLPKTPTGASMHERREVSADNAPRHFVRIVADRDKLTFEGREATWEELPLLLERIQNREATVLEVAIASDQLTLAEVGAARGRAQVLARQFGFQYSSYVGVHQPEVDVAHNDGSESDATKEVDVESKSEATQQNTEDGNRREHVPTADVLLATLREYDQTMEAGFTVEGTKIDIPGELAGGNLPPARRAWKLSMSPGKFGYESRILEVLSWRDLVGPGGAIPPRDEEPDFAFELRQKIFLNKDTLADYCYFAAEAIFEPGRVVPPTDDDPGLATRASLTTHPASEANRYGFKNDPQWAMGRGYSPFIERITSIKLLDNEWLSVAATGKDKWPVRWELLIDPEAGYLVRQSKIFWSEADSPGFVLTTSGIQQIGTVSIPKSYKLLDDTGYGEVVNSKIGGTFTNAKASADVEFLRSMESILAPPYPVPTQVVND